jgi:hypothetical protein
MLDSASYLSAPNGPVRCSSDEVRPAVSGYQDIWFNSDYHALSLRRSVRHASSVRATPLDANRNAIVVS